MNFETPRLTIRDFQAEDLTLLTPLRADHDLARFMDFNPETPERTQEWLLASIGHNQSVPRFSHHSAIILRDQNILIGWIAVGHPENEQNAIAERAFGYALGKDFWGKGFMTEAVRGLLRFCFEELKVKSVSAQCSKDNVASSKVLQKAGMEFVREFPSEESQGEMSLLYWARDAVWMPDLS